MVMTATARGAALVLGAGLVLATVSACGGGGAPRTGEDPPPGSTVTSTAPAAPQPGGGSQSASPGGTSSQTPPPAQVPQQTQALLAAGRSGLQKVPNSTVYAIDRHDRIGTWEVEVVTDDGVKYEMYASRDGRRILRGPSRDGQEAKYRERIQGAKLDFEAAVKAVLEEVPGAVFEELNLDHENGIVVWEADVIDDSGTARSLDIDAATGAILRNKPSR